MSIIMHEYDDFHLGMVLFQVCDWEGDIVFTEAIDHRWVRLDELVEGNELYDNLVASDKKSVEFLNKREKMEDDDEH